MSNTIAAKNEYRNLPLDQLTECPLNPRYAFDETALNELAASIRSQGVLMPLLVRPINPQTFEVVAGKRRFRAAQLAGAESVPVDIRALTDAECIEVAITENLQRRDVHPLEESGGYARLLDLDEPKYSIEQIAVKCAKTPAYIASRLSLAKLTPSATEAFVKEEIGLGHALLLAKLQPDEQEQALSACYQEVYGNGGKARRVLLPVRHLKEWIERNIFLDLAAAPFSKEDAELLPEAGSCLECPKRTGYNTLLFDGMGHVDRCSDPKCFSNKLDQHIKQTVAAKPKLVQISTGYGRPAEGSPVVPRNLYVEIRQDKPSNKYQREAPEFKTCKYVAEAIVSEGTEKGEMRMVCANPDCPVHHPKKQQRERNADAQIRAQQDKQRREEAIANTVGIRTLTAIAAAVPVRLMKRDLLFVVERLASMVDERRLEVVARLHDVKRGKDGDSIPRLFAAYLRRAEESQLGSALVELTILLTSARQQTTEVLKDAATLYKVDTNAIAAKVKQEFAAKENAKAAKKTEPKQPVKAQDKSGKKPAAA